MSVCVCVFGCVCLIIDELLHEVALFGLTGGSTPSTLIHSHLDFASLPYLGSLGMARPFTTKVEKGWEKRTDPMAYGGLS